MTFNIKVVMISIAVILIAILLIGVYLGNSYVKKDNEKSCIYCGFKEYTDYNYNSDKMLYQIECDKDNYIYSYYKENITVDKWGNNNSNIFLYLKTVCHKYNGVLE